MLWGAAFHVGKNMLTARGNGLHLDNFYPQTPDRPCGKHTRQTLYLWAKALPFPPPVVMAAGTDTLLSNFTPSPPGEEQVIVDGIAAASRRIGLRLVDFFTSCKKVSVAGIMMKKTAAPIIKYAMSRLRPALQERRVVPDHHGSDCHHLDQAATIGPGSSSNPTCWMVSTDDRVLV